ncbi:MAG: AMP-binding protein [Acidobacteria bacterium]|nr:AMP-binding protein [Acidobacteriota bacterium]
MENNEVLFFDEKLETLPREELQKYQERRFRKLLQQVLQSNPFYQRKLNAAGILKPVPLRRLSDLPFTTKAEVIADQLEHPLYGSNLTFPLDCYTRLHQTSGTTGVPMRWLDTPDGYQSFVKQWCFVLRGAGVQRGDRVFVAFSFGLFLGFWGGFEAVHQLGCLAISGGGQTTEQRLANIQALRPTVLLCTPTYALRMAEVAQELGMDTTALGLRITIHAGEPGASIPATRQRIQKLWGAKAHDHCGLTELGATGYECRQQLGPHVNESEFILEVIDPETTRPVSEGSRGEIVLTSLGRPGSPLIRYRTGDLADVTRQKCACGRTFALMRGGLLGRADDMITIRGVNVFPTAIENILREFSEVVEFQGVVHQQREMQELVLRLETSLQGEAQQSLAQRIASEMHIRLALRPTVEFVAPGTLPRTEMKSRRFKMVKSS